VIAAATMPRKWTAAARRIGRGDMLTLSASETVNRAARFIIAVILARAVGPDDYGAWVVAAAVGVLLMTVGDLGLGTVIVTRVAAAPALLRPYVANMLAVVAVVLGVSFAAVAGGWLAGLLGPLVAMLALAGMIDSATFLVLAPLRARNDLRPEALVRGGQGIALLAVGIPVFLTADASAQALAVVFLAVSAASLAFALLALVRAAGAVAPRLRVALTCELARAASPVLAATFVAMAYFRIDALLLAAIRGEAGAGLYAAAYNVAFGATFVAVMFGRILLPRFAQAATPGALRLSYRRSVRNLSAAAGCMLVALAAAAPLIPRVYGHEYAGALPAYAWLVGAQAAFFLTHMNYTFLYARGRAVAVWWLTVGSLVLNVALNAALIRPFGPAGAGAAALATETALLAAQLWLIRAVLHDVPHADTHAGGEPLPALAA